MTTIKEFTQILKKDYNINLSKQSVLNMLKKHNLEYEQKPSEVEIGKRPTLILLPEKTVNEMITYYKFKNK